MLGMRVAEMENDLPILADFTLNPPKTMIQRLLRCGAALAALVLSSCAVSTPGSRVAQAPQLFGPLPDHQKQAVMDGKVVEGMTPDAVYLAWGRPDRVTRGSQGGKPFELWRYTELKPVYRTDFAMGFGYSRFGYYGHGRGYYDPSWVGMDIGPDYVPVTAAVVRFSRNRVTGWERLR